MEEKNNEKVEDLPQLIAQCQSKNNSSKIHHQFSEEKNYLKKVIK